MFLIVALLLVSARRAGMIGPDIVDRVMGVLFGLYFVVIGNFMPKKLDPPKGEPCTPSRKQALLRFSGWIFVFMGLGYALVWLIFPVEQAGTVAMFVVVPGVLLVAGRTAWIYFTCKLVQPNAGA